jgi:hypothetical protein
VKRYPDASVKLKNESSSAEEDEKRTQTERKRTISILAKNVWFPLWTILFLVKFCTPLLFHQNNKIKVK